MIARSVNKKSNRIINTGPATFSSDRNQTNYVAELDMMLQRDLKKCEQKHKQLSEEMEKLNAKKDNKKLSYEEQKKQESDGYKA